MYSSSLTVVLGIVATVIFAAAEKVDAALNILPLGDSITYGYGELTNGGDPTANDLGYRRYLQQELWDSRVDYDMVGGFGPNWRSPFDPAAPAYTGPTTLTNSFGETRSIDLDHFGWT